MKRCPSCNAQIESGSWYCDQCGVEIKCCVSCGRPGTGETCANCNDAMVSARLYTTNLNKTVQSVDRSFVRVSALDKNIRIHRQVKLYLVNYPLGIRLEAADEAIIGRKEGIYAPLLKGQPYISSKHASLRCDPHDHSWSITDLGSSNGTFIDGKRLEPYVATPINRGTRVQLANIELVVELE